MSLITQCPACATMFKVVPDQLRISDGWVRCGQCDEVFDANAQLQPAFDATPVAVQSEPPQVMDWGDMVEVEADATPSGLGIPLEFPAPEQPEALPPVRVSEFDPIPSAFAFDAQRSDKDALAPVEPDATAVIEDFDANPRDDAVEQGVSEMPSSLDNAPVATLAASSIAKDPGTPQFLKQHRAQPAKGRRLARFGLVALSWLLAVSLVAQGVVQERDRIVATAPWMSEWLEPVCQTLGCKISPLQQIESIVIDHSSFSKAQSDGYLLGFAVKSTALTEVAIPSLELTLTDMQDRAVVRRVFSPSELGYQSRVLSPGEEWSGSVPVDVKLAEGGERISGYRLLAFYP